MKTLKWNSARLKQILQNFKSKKILIIGDVGIDRYTIGSVDRISPEAPVPIVFVEEEKFKLGLAANCADNVHALGAVAWLTGIIGKDRAALDFKDLLKLARIKDTHLISDSTRRTVLKERIVSGNQQLLRIDYENFHPISGLTEKKAIEKIKSLMPRCDAVILQDYAKGMLTQALIDAVFETAHEADKVVAVDPNPKTPLSMYLGASVLTPNTKEAEKLSGVTITDESSLHTAGQKILKATGAKHVVITRGREGMAVFTANSSDVHLIPTYAREVYDVSGAGDTVITVLTLALASGATIEESAILGNLAAGVEVAKRGTATVSPEEIRVAMEFFEAVGMPST
ncbi:MAG: D-glycero-beta-D-manno-heptose-7-phosphate kinase [Methylotenera sp.]|nr:D-glycero-beta-D-manno-heptose-7-phosphate kinase [Oligoflexia bacterium]